VRLLKKSLKTREENRHPYKVQKFQKRLDALGKETGKLADLDTAPAAAKKVGIKVFGAIALGN
jgi:hypothetical protein